MDACPLCPHDCSECPHVSEFIDDPAEPDDVSEFHVSPCYCSTCDNEEARRFSCDLCGKTLDNPAFCHCFGCGSHFCWECDGESTVGGAHTLQDHLHPLGEEESPPTIRDHHHGNGN